MYFKITVFLVVSLLIAGLSIAVFTVFFDQAVLTRRGTVYHVNESDKVVALTFDDGPSLKWTPLILDELKENKIKATFFMIGQHIEKYPEIAKRVAEEGHEIENHRSEEHTSELQSR